MSARKKAVLYLCMGICALSLFAGCDRANEGAAVKGDMQEEKTGQKVQENTKEVVEQKGNENIKEEKKTVKNTSKDLFGLKGELPIGMWVSPPNERINNKRYQEIKESGINVVLGFMESTPDKIMAALDASKANGLRFVVRDLGINAVMKEFMDSKDPSVLSKIKDYTSQYKDHEAFAGNLLYDEPGKPLFEPLKAVVDAYKTEHPDKIAYINLFPSYAFGGIQTHTYEDYVTSWLDTVNPDYISYDHYPLLKNGTEERQYYYDLSIIRQKTVEKEIPFMVFIQTVEFGSNPGVPARREPNEQEIRWQVYMSLAFGAKGIQYFTYWTPKSGTETFGKAMIDLIGNKTERYFHVQKVNTEIKEIGRTLMNLTSVGVMEHLGTGDSGAKMYSKLDTFAPIEKVEGSSAMIGCFEDANGSKKIILVNKSCHDAGEVKITLKDIKSCKVWTGGKMEEVQAQNNVLELKLEAGEGKFIEF